MLKSTRGVSFLFPVASIACVLLHCTTTTAFPTATTRRTPFFAAVSCLDSSTALFSVSSPDEDDSETKNKKKGENSISSGGSTSGNEPSEVLLPREEEMVVGGDGGGSQIDWDAEWKKVVQRQKEQGLQKESAERPGKGYYKSELEVATIKAVNKASRQIDRAVEKIELPSIPSFNSLKGDWKFWIGVLALLSFGTALLTASAPPPESSTLESYYI